MEGRLTVRNVENVREGFSELLAPVLYRHLLAFQHGEHDPPGFRRQVKLVTLHHVTSR